MIKHISLYGDESINNNIACYCICGLATDLIPALEDIINSVKKEFGMTNNHVLHCKELFHDSGRGKIAPHLKQKDIESLYLKIAYKVKTLYLVCSYFDKRLIPTQQTLGYRDKVTTAYYGDPELVHIAKNACMIEIVNSRKKEDYAFYPDPNLSGRIRWCNKNKAKTMHDGNNVLISETSFGANADDFIRLQHSTLQKTSIHQIADFIAYSFAKAKSVQHFHNKQFFIDVMKILNPKIRGFVFNNDNSEEDWLYKFGPFETHIWS